MEQSELFTSYTIKQAQTIKHALESQGFCDPERWPGYLDRITRKMRVAAVMEYRTVREPLPRSSKAAKQLRGFAKALDRAAREYNKLCPELQLMIDDAVPVTSQFPELKAALPTSTDEQLASSARFAVWLQVIRDAAEQAAGPLTSHPAPISPEALSLVSAEVAKELMRKRRKQAGLFQLGGQTGLPRLLWTHH
jgi:hypothetical protein